MSTLSARELERQFELAYRDAHKGHADAQCELGCCYEYGDGIARDLKRAAEWYQKAADQGYAPAQNNLGVCYGHGFGVNRDQTMAAKWFRKAADQGFADAQIDLGLRYERGDGVDRDPKLAVEWYRKAADQGSARAQNNLAHCYRKGIGVDRDPNLAVEWYRKAADQGCTRSQANLGKCYEDGLGVQRDLESAVKWYRKVADQGVAHGQCHLGRCYHMGIGVERDARMAVEWYRKAADQEHAPAQFNLGICYANGIGVERDARMAVEWFRKAADQGDAHAQFNLGICYANGVGVDEDMNKGVEWFRKAADQGDAHAQSEMGWCYHNGTGVEKNAKQALELYRLVLKGISGRGGGDSWMDAPQTGKSELFEETFARLISLQEVEIKRISEQLNMLIGLARVKDEINKLTALALTNIHRRRAGRKASAVSLHLVFLGNPGTGKTTVARLVAELYYTLGYLDKGHCVEVKRSDLVAEYVGQTAPKTESVINRALDGLLFVDEAYSLVPDDSFRDFGQEAVASLMLAMENYRGRLVVIVAGYPEEMHHFICSNPGLQSRFNRFIEFDDYNPGELRDIFLKFAEEGEYVLTKGAIRRMEECMRNLWNCRGKHTGNARAARNLFETAVMMQSVRYQGLDVKTEEDLTEIAEIDIDNSWQQMIEKLQRFNL